jgi:hypothetical protein
VVAYLKPRKIAQILTWVMEHSPRLFTNTQITLPLWSRNTPPRDALPKSLTTSPQHHQSITKRTAQNIISINGGMTMINTSGVGLNLLVKVTFTSKNTLLMLT